MKFALNLVLFVALVPMLVADAAAQSNSSAEQSVAELRAQLAAVQAKETELQARARQLDEALRPENIERSLAGIGSTRPEELREQRRRQLTIEQNSVRTQLNMLATSRERLESAIRREEGFAYQQSAEGFATPLNQTMIVQNTGKSRWAIGMLAGLVAVMGLILVIAAVLRSYRAASLHRN
jgi:hypothetical protein